jgi:hypothetical protein
MDETCPLCTGGGGRGPRLLPQKLQVHDLFDSHGGGAVRLRRGCRARGTAGGRRRGAAPDAARGARGAARELRGPQGERRWELHAGDFVRDVCKDLRTDPAAPPLAGQFPRGRADGEDASGGSAPPPPRGAGGAPKRRGRGVCSWRVG